MSLMHSGNMVPEITMEEHNGLLNAKKVDIVQSVPLTESLESLTETLQELIQRLAPLAGAVANTAQLRVTQTAVPSTAVTGPATSAQVVAALLTQTNSLINAQVNNNPLVPVLANINNVEVV